MYCYRTWRDTRVTGLMMCTRDTTAVPSDTIHFVALYDDGFGSSRATRVKRKYVFRPYMTAPGNRADSAVPQYGKNARSFCFSTDVLSSFVRFLV